MDGGREGGVGARVRREREQDIDESCRRTNSRDKESEMKCRRGGRESVGRLVGLLKPVASSVDEGMDALHDLSRVQCSVSSSLCFHWPFVLPCVLHESQTSFVPIPPIRSAVSSWTRHDDRQGVGSHTAHSREAAVHPAAGRHHRERKLQETSKQGSVKAVVSLRLT